MTSGDTATAARGPFQMAPGASTFRGSQMLASELGLILPAFSLRAPVQLAPHLGRTQAPRLVRVASSGKMAARELRVFARPRVCPSLQRRPF